MNALTPDQTPDGWDRPAHAYERSITRLTSPHAEETVRLAEIGPGDRVLDVAAGTGAATVAAAGAGADVLATDYSQVMVECLRDRIERERVGSVEVALMDGQNLDVPDGSFDAATSVFGLMFFPDQARGFAELHRVVRPGGRAAVTTWASPDRNLGISLFGQAVRQVEPDAPVPASPPAVFSLQDPEALAGYLSAAGFGDVRVEPVVRQWHFDSAQAFWDELHDASPVIMSTIERLGDRTDEVRAALFGMLGERFGDGEVTFDMEALVGLGTK